MGYAPCRRPPRRAWYTSGVLVGGGRAGGRRVAAGRAGRGGWEQGGGGARMAGEAGGAGELKIATGSHLGAQREPLGRPWGVEWELQGAPEVLNGGLM